MNPYDSQYCKISTFISYAIRCSTEDRRYFLSMKKIPESQITSFLKKVTHTYVFFVSSNSIEASPHEENRFQMSHTIYSRLLLLDLENSHFLNGPASCSSYPASCISNRLASAG